MKLPKGKFIDDIRNVANLPNPKAILLEEQKIKEKILLDFENDRLGNYYILLTIVERKEKDERRRAARVNPDRPHEKGNRITVSRENSYDEVPVEENLNFNVPVRRTTRIQPSSDDADYAPKKTYEIKD